VTYRSKNITKINSGFNFRHEPVSVTSTGAIIPAVTRTTIAVGTKGFLIACTSKTH